MSAISLVSYVLFTVSVTVVLSIMKLIELAVGVTCKKYLTEKTVPDLKMDPIPNDQIDDKTDELIEKIVLVVRKEEGLVQTVLRKAARWKAGAIVNDLKEFQTRNEYEQVKEKELIHFMAEWKSKSMAEVFCGLPIVMAYVTGIGVVGAFLVSGFFAWF